MIYYYLKPYADPEENRLHFFGCTPVFEELEQVFFNLSLMAKNNEAVANVLENMTLHFD